MNGGTYDNSVAQATNTALFIQSSSLSPSLMLYTNSSLSPSDYATPLIFKYSYLVHDDIPRYYFHYFVQQFGEACGLTSEWVENSGFWVLDQISN